MKALLFSGLVLALPPVTADARPAPRDPGKPHMVMQPLEEAATACFAETVMANPKATRLARQGQWYEAAGVIGFLCRPEVGRMMAAHDRLYGAGTGERYFQGRYAKHLGQQLAERLQPLLEGKAVASAEMPEKAAAEDAVAEPAQTVEGVVAVSH